MFLGHVGFKAAVKAAGSDINMNQELQTGAHLGSAAAFSGFVWQPSLNAMQALECSFNASMLGVGVACTLAFYTGLRVFRKLYGSVLKWDHIEESNYTNLKADAVSEPVMSLVDKSNFRAAICCRTDARHNFAALLASA